jgi:non-specific serine/threonine protein kinase
MPHNLPAQLTQFIGRKREIADVKRTLAETRLLTLTGPGGCGKTRLALQVANTLKDSWPDGVWWVEFVSLREPALVPQLITQALGILRAGEQSALTLLNHIQSKAMLLVLENCEHLPPRTIGAANLTKRLNSTFWRPAANLAVAGEMLYLSGLALSFS